MPPLNTKDNIGSILNEGVTGETTIDASSRVVFDQLLAFHVLIRSQNNKNIALNFKIDEFEAAQAALRFARIVLLESDEEAQKESCFDLMTSRDTITRVKNNFKEPGDATLQSELVSVLGNTTFKDYAKSLLNDLDPYVQKQTFSDKAGGQDTLKKQISTLKAIPEVFEPEYNKPNWNDRTLNFLMRSSLFTLLFLLPYAPAIIGGLGFSAGLYYSFTGNPKRPYGRRYANKPYLKIPQAIADGLTAIVFEPLRYIFSYDDWEQKNKDQFDKIESYLFFPIFAVLTLPYTLARGVYDSILKYNQNFKSMWSCGSDDDINNLLDDPEKPPYGLTVLRGFRWLRDFGTNYPNTTIAIQILLGPLTLVYLGLKALKIDVPSVPTKVWARAAALLSPIFWPADLIAGALMGTIRLLWPDTKNSFEKTFHKFISSLEFSVILSFLGPMIWGGLLVVAWAPLVKLVESFVTVGTNMQGIPFADIVHGIWKYTGAEGAMKLWFGANGIPGLFAQGWTNFAGGIKGMAIALADPNTWAPLGKFLSSGQLITGTAAVQTAKSLGLGIIGLGLGFRLATWKDKKDAFLSMLPTTSRREKTEAAVVEVREKTTKSNELIALNPNPKGPVLLKIEEKIKNPLPPEKTPTPLGAASSNPFLPLSSRTGEPTSLGTAKGRGNVPYNPEKEGPGSRGGSKPDNSSKT